MSYLATAKNLIVKTVFYTTENINSVADDIRDTLLHCFNTYENFWRNIHTGAATLYPSFLISIEINKLEQAIQEIVYVTTSIDIQFNQVLAMSPATSDLKPYINDAKFHHRGVMFTTGVV